MGRGDETDDAGAGMAVAERIVSPAHAAVGMLVVEQAAGFADDAVGVGADQDRGPGLDGFGTLRRVPQHEDRLAEARSLFLHAAAVGQH